MKRMFCILALCAVLVSSLCVSFVGCAKTNEEAPEDAVVLSVVDIVNSAELSLILPEGAGDGFGDFSGNSRTLNLTATLYPTSATDKTVDWELGWADVTDSWTNGKDPSTYVSVTPTSPGATTAVVRATSAFASNINVVCTSRANPNCVAICTVKYAARVQASSQLQFEYDNATYASTGSRVFPSLSQNRALYSYNFDIDFLPTWSLHTVDVINLSYTLQVKAKPALYCELQAQGIAKASNDWITITKEHELWNAFTASEIAYVGDFDALSSGLQSTTSNRFAERRVAFNNAVLSNTSGYDFDVKATIITDFETRDLTWTFTFDRSNISYTAERVTLSPSSFVL